MKFFTSLLAVLPVILAAPTVELEARSDPETLYLTNCVQVGGFGTLVQSWGGYYAAGHGSQNGQVPDSTCIFTNNGNQHWEGTSPTCTFSQSGVQVTAHIDANAASQPLFSGCGWATNGFHNFNCFRDNGRQLYATGLEESSIRCNSIYYCLPA